MSLGLGLIFFIKLPFASGRPPGADDPDHLAFLSMRYYENALPIRHSNCEKSLIIRSRMVRVGKCSGEPVVEDGRGLTEIDAVLSYIRGGLRGVPLENHIASIPVL